MEGGDGLNKETSKTSTDEHSSTEQSTDDATSGRFYECIFCKRGFSTAQALGGHMNIHRKDRAKLKHNNNPSASKDSKQGDDQYNNPFINNFNSQHRSSYPPVSESLKNYSTFFPVHVSSRDDVMGSSMRPRELSLFSDHQKELCLGLRVHGDGRRVVLGHDERREMVKDQGDVDLELRLGL